MDFSLQAGHSVSHSYNAGYVVLSYIVSFSGAWTALELLHRRTSARGLYNWYLLLAAASSMGTVAIWSMHFIGNRAIQMASGQAKYQIEYNPGYTAGSFFLPICVVGAAFYFFSTTEKVSVFATLLGGVLTGAAVCGMHYMGQGGISNYVPVYIWGYVLGSALISVTASTAALSIFFYLKSTWTNSWIKRMACASLLATSVSGMHWVATVGTAYRLKAGAGSSNNGLSRQATVIVVLCLALGCCFALLVLAIIGRWSKKLAADRAQQVVLACATFDMDGKLMVTHEGLLPCRKITNAYGKHSFEGTFDVEHPVFCWIYRASRCWSGIANLIPAIREHMRGHSPKVSRRGTSSNQLGPYERASTLFEDTEDYTRLFKEMFLVAAGDLANELQEPLENIGILFEDIMSTGTVRKRKRRLCSRFPEMDVLDRVERGPSTDLFGRGQLLFLVRRASRQESIKIQSTGYRFADVSNVIDFLAGSMEVTQRELLPCFKRMEAQAGKSNMLEPGAHLALFALRAMPKRLEVLVRSDAKNLLHATRLRLPRFVPQDEKWHQNILDTLDNMNSVECKAKLIALMSCGESDEKYHVLQELHAGVHRLFEGVPDELHSDARLMARPFRAPCCSTPANLNPERAYVIAFQVIVDIHKIIVPGPNKEFVSTKLFLCQQPSYQDATDNDTFVRQVRKEFAGLLEVIELPQTLSVSPSSRQQTAPSTLSRSRAASSEDVVSSGESSTKNLESDRSSQSYGGIHVSKEVSIDISDNPLGEDSSGIEMTIVGSHKLRVPVGHTMGNRIQAGVKVTDGDHETWMDRLLALTIDGRNRPEALSR